MKGALKALQGDKLKLKVSDCQITLTSEKDTLSFDKKECHCERSEAISGVRHCEQGEAILVGYAPVLPLATCGPVIANAVKQSRG